MDWEILLNANRRRQTTMPGDVRVEFERDYDRSVFSTPVKRLPETTFFNLEAIAVDVWPQIGKARSIYSGDDQFFEGIITRTLELNRPENPFPGLCIVRSLV